MSDERTMTADIIALRAHLVAEAEYARREADKCRERADGCARVGFPPGTFATAARTATDAWLASDARLRALDGLLEAVIPRTP